MTRPHGALSDVATVVDAQSKLEPVWARFELALRSHRRRGGGRGAEQLADSSEYFLALGTLGRRAPFQLYRHWLCERERRHQRQERAQDHRTCARAAAPFIG